MPSLRHESTPAVRSSSEAQEGQRAADPSPRPGFRAGRLLECRRQLPELVSDAVHLRELRFADAPSLSEALGSPTVHAHMAVGPRSVVEILEFIVWTRQARREGRYICFGAIPPGSDQVVGLFQVWPIGPGFGGAERGFAIGNRFWGTGLFEAGARLTMRFAFASLGVVRLEARVSVDNGRGNGALRKLGAVQEGILRKCFLADGDYRDHVMWSILAEEWFAQEAPQVAGEVA